MKKKLMCLIIAVIMMLNCSIVAFAAEEPVHDYKAKYEQMFSLMKKLSTKPQVVLEKNNLSYDGHRHIKIDWEHIDYAAEYRIQIADNKYFKNATDIRRLSGKGTYYNFANLDNNAEATYYIRLRPLFILGKYNDNYVTVLGRWSKTIVAPCTPINLDNLQYKGE